MGLKKQLWSGLASADLGVSLIGGGTYAYFSDSEQTNNSFAAGTLDLTAEPTEIIDVDELQPGDSVIRDFELQNTGSLDMNKVTLDTDYSVIYEGGDNDRDFGEDIEVEFLYNADNMDEVIYETTLADLKDMSPEAVNENVFYPELGDKGLEAGDSHDLVVKFNFLDSDEDQNQFQGDSLKLEWTFNAEQGDGDEK